MKTVLYAAPAVEPITLQEVKDHLRLDSGAFADNVDTLQSIAPASYSANVGYALLGSAVDVLSYEAVVNVISGTNSAGGTVDIKIQHSDDNITWTDWTGGAFTQITTATDNATFEKAYTGGKRYIRAAANILVAACVFGVTVSRRITTSTEDTSLTRLITLAREFAEGWTWRKFCTQTIDIYFDDFPTTDNIVLPFGNLQSVTHFKYTDSDGTETTLTENTDYFVEENGPEYGRLVLPNDVTWPTATLKSSNPITVRFVCGYGAAADVPQIFKQAMLLNIGDSYRYREAHTEIELKVNPASITLLNMRRLF